MQNLEKRIAALEATGVSDNHFSAIMHRVVSPGHLDAEIDHIRDHDGNEWTRQPGEVEEAFTDRVISNVKRKPLCIPHLIGDTLDLRHAKP